ncbi:cytochrome b5 domain-containing protein [Clostridium rectalis]|uniref:cytochrome b5 domain-containing protein n=1 Tax=Clostridium rectalis TaxID=2040295 RepID=UPI0013DDC0D4|nr:cytochrome b5 domain-containing protein [Clostridium rectalis]
MKPYQYEKLIHRMEQNIYSLQVISFMSINMCEKVFYHKLAIEEMYKLDILKDFICNMNYTDKIYRNNINVRQQRFTLEELSKYDGKNGNKAYVAIDGVVYDVTYTAAWAAGTHFGLKAGKDLSKELTECHNKEKIIKILTPIGTLNN